jgi:soluble lytic murein transglycosylase-like protein
VKGREYDPAWNINAGAAIIAENLERYDYPRCIAVYNSYDQRKLPVDGPFKNQAYVNKVRGFYEDFQQRFTE